MFEQVIQKDVLFHAMMDAAVDAIILVDKLGSIQFFSKSAEKLFGYTSAECMQQNIKMLMPEPYHSAHDGYLTHYHKSQTGNIIGKGREVFGKTKSGKIFPMHLSVGRVQLAGEIGFIGICHDLTLYNQTLLEKEKALQEANYLKSHDVLTGLFNVASVCELFPDWCMPTLEYAVLYFDFNHLGLINDKYGYSFGDKILLQAARRMTKCQPHQSIIARSVSDEFVAVVAVKHIEEAHAIANQLLHCLEKEYLVEGEVISLTGKVGVSMYPSDNQDIEVIIRQAATALSQAKAEHSQIAYYQASCHEALKRQLDIEQGLKKAIQANRLEIYLQAKVNLASHEITGYEALLRWQDAELGWVSPAEFIPVAEKLNLAIQLDRYVLNSVLHNMSLAIEQGLQVKPVAINITSQHFADPSLAQYIIMQADYYSVPLDLLELELTEGTLLERCDAQIANLTCLRNLGVKIAIDDFGTGYSSLSYLRNLMVDVLKIDKSFIDDIFTEQGRVLIEVIIALAKSTGLKVVAEGIESKGQADLLTLLGCELGQGYLFAKPTPIKHVLQLEDQTENVA